MTVEEIESFDGRDILIKPAKEKKEDWDEELMRRYGYEFDYWNEYKPWIYGE